MRRTMNLGLVLMLATALNAEVVFQDDFEGYDSGLLSMGTWQGAFGRAEYEGWLTMETFDDASKAYSGTKGYRAYCYNSDGISVGGSLRTTTPLRPDGASDGTFTGSFWTMIGNLDPSGSGCVSSKVGLFFRDDQGHIGTYATIVSDRWNRNRRIDFYNGATKQTLPVAWATDTYMNFQVTVDEVVKKWGFSLLSKDGTVLGQMQDLDYTLLGGNTFDGISSMMVYFEDGMSGNDGFYNQVDDVLIDFTPAITQIPGDANNDGIVDVGDLGILAGHYGMEAGVTWEQGDFNGDGKVDVGDLGILAGNYGTGTAQTPSVPEPTSLLLLGMGLFGVLRRKR